MRTLTVLTVLALVAPTVLAYAYDPADYPAATVTVVQGHTVHAELEARFCGVGDGMVACNEDRDPSEPLPGAPSRAEVASDVGVAWFNDQRLVAASGSAVAVHVSESTPEGLREPCGGWVLATAAGLPDPRGSSATLAYVESYRIEDPNGYVWIVDRFAVAGVPGADVFTVPVIGYDVADTGPASGFTCAAYPDTAPSWDAEVRAYNAVLFFPIGTGRPGGLAWGDAAHAADPNGPRDAAHPHATSAFDVYFSNVRPPSPLDSDRAYVVYDTEGDGAPYDDEDGDDLPIPSVPTVEPPARPAPPSDVVLVAAVGEPRSGDIYGYLPGGEGSTCDWKVSACFIADAGATYTFVVLAALDGPDTIIACFEDYTPYGIEVLECTATHGSALSVDAPASAEGVTFTVLGASDVAFRLDGRPPML